MIEENAINNTVLSEPMTVTLPSAASNGLIIKPMEDDITVTGDGIETKVRIGETAYFAQKKRGIWPFRKLVWVEL